MGAAGSVPSGHQWRSQWDDTRRKGNKRRSSPEKGIVSCCRASASLQSDRAARLIATESFFLESQTNIQYNNVAGLGANKRRISLPDRKQLI